MVRAVIFDFDGVIVETEEPLFRVWQRIYRERGAELPMEQWLTIIGTAGASFDPIVDLGRRSGKELNREEMDALEQAYYQEAAVTQELLPGVRRYLDEAGRLNLKTAIASSSHRPWIDEHLERMGIRNRFDLIVCRDDVTRVKPDPELYVTVLARLGLDINEAIAIEDSSNGLRAAKAAGLYCVAVPTPMTAAMDLGRADLRLSSLEEIPLAELIRRPRSARSPRPGPGLPGAPISD